MTQEDKEKIKAEIERLRKQDGNPYYPSESADLYYARGVHFTCDNLLRFIDSLPEEPVSGIWHESNEEPIDKGHCIVNYGSNKYFDFELCLYDKKQACFITEKYLHPTGYEIEIPSCEGNCVMKQYQTKRDKILLPEINKWAYLDDLLHKKEEPVSEDLEDAVNAYIGHKPDVDESSSVYGKRQAFKAGAQWKNEKIIEKACEWLQKNDSYSKPTELQVRDFRKYMEEEL